MKHAILGCILVFMLSGCATGRDVCEDTNKDSQKINLELYLVDGSRIIGVPKIETVPLETSYAKISIPLAKIQSIKMSDDHETAALDLRDGDKLKGVVSLDPIKLETVFGSVKIDMKHIQKMEIMLHGRLGQNGLLLWNRLGSENEVWNSRVGPGGKLNAGRFVESRFGKGIELNMQEQMGVTFPPEIVPAPAGCIEFWAKLIGFPTDIRQPGGAWPLLVGTSVLNFGMAFTANNGAASGGLVQGVPGLGGSGTGLYGYWTYASALKTTTANDWHHYALVWSGEGIPGVDNGQRRLISYVDGNLNTGHWIGTTGTRFTGLTNVIFGLLAHQGVPAGSIAYDNIKIWNFAKTDFSDRNNE